MNFKKAFTIALMLVFLVINSFASVSSQSQLQQPAYSPQPLPLSSNYTLEISIIGNGTVQVTPELENYTQGTIVALEAIPNSTWVFDRWGADHNGFNNVTTIIIDGNKTITATFMQEAEFDKHLVKFTVEGNGNLSSPFGGTMLVPAGLHNLTALPDAGWEFSHWAGDLNSSENPLGLYIYQSMNITCVFTQIPITYYTLTINPVGNGSILKDPDASSYPAGTHVNLTAIADSGWTFSNWSGDATGEQNPIEIIIDSDKNITCSFEQNTTQDDNDDDDNGGGSGGGGSGGGGDSGDSGDSGDTGDDDNTTTGDGGDTGGDTNTQPDTLEIDGPNEGITDEDYNYEINGTDSDGDPLTYIINWGDGTIETYGPYAEGNPFYATHNWTAPGTYRIRITSNDGSTNSNELTYTVTITEPPSQDESEDGNIFWYIMGGSTALLGAGIGMFLTKRRYFYD